MRVTVHDRVGWVEYDRPPVNAFHWEMLREKPEALEEHLADPAVRVVVFGSALEAHFSVGADLRVFAVMEHVHPRTVRQAADRFAELLEG